MSGWEDAGWQDIATAPKDGKTPVQLRSAMFAPAHVFIWSKGRWETRILGIMGLMVRYWPEDEDGPTEWLPSPPSPEKHDDKG